MSEVVDRVQTVRAAADGAMKGLAPGEGDPLRGALGALVAKADAIRQEIVATKEGGAITGEERIREHTEDVYSALLGYEGRPAATLVDRTEALQRELGDVRKEVEALERTEVPKVNERLKAAGRQVLEIARPVPRPGK
jgi:hypothetical protein